MPKIVKSLTRDDLAVLALDSVFRGAAFAVLRKNLNLYRCWDYSDGDRLFQQGTEVEGLFVVLKGLVTLLDETATHPRPHGTIEAGQSLGDYELFADGGPTYEITGKAMGEVRALFVPKVEVMKYIHEAGQDPRACLAINAAKDLAGKSIRTCQRLKAVYQDGTYLLAQVIAYNLKDRRAGTNECREIFARLHPTLAGHLPFFIKELKSLKIISRTTRNAYWHINVSNLASLINCSAAGLESVPRPLFANLKIFDWQDGVS